MTINKKSVFTRMIKFKKWQKISELKINWGNNL